MKMRFPFFAVAAASVFAASCTADKDLYDENYKNEVVEATYEDQFMKMVGSIGAQQDFNMAQTTPSLLIQACLLCVRYLPLQQKAFVNW